MWRCITWRRGGTQARAASHHHRSEVQEVSLPFPSLVAGCNHTLGNIHVSCIHAPLQMPCMVNYKCQTGLDFMPCVHVQVEVREQGPLRATLQLTMQLTPTSSLKQRISLTAVSARWVVLVHLRKHCAGARRTSARCAQFGHWSVK